MGRPADPTRRRRKTGNRPQASGGGGQVAVPLEDTPDPVGLPEAAVPLFRAVVAELAPRGALGPADVEAITMMCWSAWTHAEARRLIAEHGVLGEGLHGPVINPMVKVARDEAATFQRIAAEYGLTLASRLKLGILQLAGESILKSLADDLDGPTVPVQVER